MLYDIFSEIEIKTKIKASSESEAKRQFLQMFNISENDIIYIEVSKTTKEECDDCYSRIGLTRKQG